MISILREIKITHYKYNESHLYSNSLLHVVFTGIFEAFSYVALKSNRQKHNVTFLIQLCSTGDK